MAKRLMAKRLAAQPSSSPPLDEAACAIDSGDHKDPVSRARAIAGIMGHAAARVRSGAHTGFLRALDLVVPASCPICQTLVHSDGGLCGPCWRQVPWIEEPVCNRLGLPLAYDLGPGAVSAEALANPPDFNRMRAACTYDGVAPRLVHALKYGRQRHLAESLGAMMARAGRSLLSDPDTVLVPVPLHPLRQLQRRYNQSALLARVIGEVTGVTVVHDAVKRVKRTRQQNFLSRGDRLRNLQGAFRLTSTGHAALADRSVVLVDDVHTTGATLNALAHTIGALHGATRPRRIDALVFSTTIVRPSEGAI